MNKEEILLEKMISILEAYEFVLITKNIKAKNFKNRISSFLSVKKGKKQKLEYVFYLIKRAKVSISKGSKPTYTFKKIQRYLVSSGLYDKSDIDFHNNPKSSF